MSDAEDTIDVIKRIPKAGPYDEIEARISSIYEAAGIRFVARSGKGIFVGATDKDGWLHLRVPPGLYKLTTRSTRFSLVSWDLNPDQPDRLIVHKGGSVQLDYDAELK